MPESAQLVPLASAHVLPALIADAGNKTALRFVDLLTVNIRKPNTRVAYAHAAACFLRWCEGQGLALSATYNRCMWPRISNCCRASGRFPR